MMDKIKKEVKKIEEEIIEWRRYFHQYPELGFEEYKTSKKIQSILKKLNIPFETKAKTGVVGYIKGKKKGKTIGIRADMDALPVKEETGLPFSSKNSGVMHACGHDGHMAVLLGVAKILKKFEKDLHGNVKLIFQPSEEKPPGGAKKMIEEGVIENIDFLLGFHFFSTMPLYKIWIGKGPVMANTDAFRIILKGKGGHGSAPHLTDDVITTASYLITQFQTIVSRKIDPLIPAVVSIGKISGGEVFNVIPEKVEILGTVRSLSPSIRKKIKKEIEKITENICKTSGCKGEIEYNEYSPVSINNPSLSETILEITEKSDYSKYLMEFKPIMGGEDFAFFSEKVPSCYIFIGIGKKCGSHHSSSFNLDEKILPFATSYLTFLLWRLSLGMWKGCVRRDFTKKEG